MTALVAENITRTFGSGAAGITAVDDASLTAHPGEVVMILGPSGSGKTTLLSILGGLLRPTRGTVRIDGALLDPARAETSQLRLERVGFVFQSYNLLPALTAVENVALPLRLRGVRRSSALAEATRMLSALELADRLHARPGTLSGGEKQRVSIARALVGRPRVVLADEPTASLDTRRGREAVELLTSLARQGEQACVLVTHDQRLAEFADRVVELHDGRLQAGTA
jgi:putative ABC transport system ATP-binding protein